MKEKRISYNRTFWCKTVLAALGLAALYWLIESLVHAFVLGEGNLAQSLAGLDAHDAWTHSVAAVILFAASVVFQVILHGRRRSVAWVQGLNALKEELLPNGELNAKLGKITDAVVDVFGADFARIWITETGDLCSSGCVHAAAPDDANPCHRGRCLHLLASSGRYTHTDGEVHRRVPLGSYKIGRIAAGEDSRCVTNDVARDPRIHDRAWARELGLVSFAGYRLASPEGTPIGVLALFSKHAITPHEDMLLESVASTAAQVIQTARAEEAVLRKTEQQEELLSVARQLTATLDTEEVLTRIGTEAKSILRAYGCAIYLLEPDGSDLKPVVAIEPPYEEQILGATLDIETSFTGQAVKAGRGLIFNESASDSRGYHIPGTEEVENENVMVAPFLVDGNVVGVMCLSRLGTRFSTDDLALAETFAAYASVALKNATTHQETCRQVERTRLAEEALRESEERFRRVFNRVFDACIMVDEKHRIVLTNEAASTMLGYSHEELRAMSMKDIVPQCELERMGEVIQKVRESGAEYVGETAVLTRTGETVPVEAGGATVNAGGKTYTLSSFRDVSQRKRAEEALKKRALELAERVRELKCLYEVTRLMRDTSQPLSRVLGAAVGAVAAGWQYPEVACSRIELNGTVRSTPQWSQTNWVQRADVEIGGRIIGSIEVAYLEERPEADEGAFLKEERELIDTLATLFGDFVRRKETEEALLQQASFVMNNPAPVFLADHDLRIMACNTAASDFFEGNLSLARVPDLFPGLTESVLKDIEPTVPYQVEQEIDKNTLLLTVKKEPFTRSFYIYASDISDRKLTEMALAQKAEELARANAQLECANSELLELDRMKSDFLSNVSHELRTPLAAVKAYAETLVDYSSMPEEKRHSFMNIIIEQSERLSAVIEDLLDLSRIEAGKVKLSLVPLRVKNVMETAMLSVAPSAEKKRIDIRVDPASEEIFVVADEQRLVQILVNLLGNAVKFTGPGGSIELCSTPAASAQGEDQSEEARPAYARITVSDNGEGIPSEEQERVFDKFKQVANSIKGKPGGTGLGLAICKDLVENMGGRIWVESEVRKGSRFHFTLPLAQDAGSEDTLEEAESSQRVS
ncbi:MAG: PAS domain S-box protein [Candidatus Eiseniibacteriota bacterium]|nr:MAG: PAS domain S-box protein [Candidatus Eisenbacteria bacterium]